MTLGPTPWYQIALQYAAYFVQLLYWIAIPTVLFLARRDFRRLVDYYVLEEIEIVEEEIVTEPAKKAKKAIKSKKEGE